MGVDLNLSYNVLELRNPCPQSALHLSWGVCNANYLSHSEKGAGHTAGVSTALLPSEESQAVKSVLSTQCGSASVEPMCAGMEGNPQRTAGVKCLLCCV